MSCGDDLRVEAQALTRPDRARPGGEGRSHVAGVTAKPDVRPAASAFREPPPSSSIPPRTWPGSVWTSLSLRRERAQRAGPLGCMGGGRRRRRRGGRRSSRRHVTPGRVKAVDTAPRVVNRQPGRRSPPGPWTPGRGSSLDVRPAGSTSIPETPASPREARRAPDSIRPRQPRCRPQLRLRGFVHQPGRHRPIGARPGCAAPAPIDHRNPGPIPKTGRIRAFEYARQPRQVLTMRRRPLVAARARSLPGPPRLRRRPDPASPPITPLRSPAVSPP